MLRFITTADTEILATAAAVRRLPADFPEVRCANPQGTRDIEPFLDHVLAGARVVVVRVLGGRRGWLDGVDRLAERCRADGIALIALGGESRPDAEMTALSTVPSGAVAPVGEYLQSGDVDNVEQLLRFLADTFLLEGFGFESPAPVPELGVYLPGRGDVSLEEALAGRDPSRPVVGIAFYRSHRLTGNTDFVDGLCAAIVRAGGHPVAVWTYTLRRAHDADGRVAALELLDGHVDALVTTMLATGGANRGDAAGDLAAEDGGFDEQMAWDASALEALGVPVIQALCVTMSRARWEEGDEGLFPIDAATQVAIPEFDGRIIGGPISFKERERRRLTGRRRRPAVRPGRRALRSPRDPRAAPRAAARRHPAPPGRHRPDRLPDEARAYRHGRRPRHAGLRDRPAASPQGRRHRRPRHPGRRRRAHAPAHRRRRPRSGVPHRRAARRCSAADLRRRLPRVVRHAASRS